MRIKMKYNASGGFVKSESSVNIKEVMINEDFLHPKNESIAICFKNNDSSGIIEFSSNEFEKLANTVKRKAHLLKSVKVFSDKPIKNK